MSLCSGSARSIASAFVLAQAESNELTVCSTSCFVDSARLIYEINSACARTASRPIMKHERPRKTKHLRASSWKGINPSANSLPSITYFLDTPRSARCTSIPPDVVASLTRPVAHRFRVPSPPHTSPDRSSLRRQFRRINGHAWVCRFGSFYTWIGNDVGVAEVVHEVAIDCQLQAN